MTHSILANKMTVQDIALLEVAKQKMKQVSWAMEGLSKVGNIIESRIALLPKKQQQWLKELSQSVLMGVVKSNLISMKNRSVKATPWNKTYKALVTSSGFLGGALGASAFAVDLGISTKFIMRSIMDIARSEGEDLNTLDTQWACLQVFALGERSEETGYYASRIGVNSTLKGGTKALEGVLASTGNPLFQLVATIASRFSIQVSEKFVAQATPILGAAGGATINLVFIHHYQRMAEAHFSVRRLERIYGESLVQKTYERL